MTSHKYPVLTGDSIVQHLNAYLGVELTSELELLSPETTRQVFVRLVVKLVGCTDQEQNLRPDADDQSSPSSLDQSLLTALLPRLLRAAQVACPLSLCDLGSAQSSPDRSRRLFDALSGLINLLIFNQQVARTRLASAQAELEGLAAREAALKAETAASRRQAEQLRAELESGSGQVVVSLTRQVEAARLKVRARENEMSAERHSADELAARREAQDQEAAGQAAMAKSMRARKAKLEEQAVSSPDGLVHLKTKMAEDIEQRKALCESRYRRLDEIESHARAAKSQLRLSELLGFFDEADRHRQVLANALEAAETMEGESGRIEARLRLLVAEVSDALSKLEALTQAAGASASAATVRGGDDNSSRPPAQAAAELRQRLAALEELRARAASAAAEERELAGQADELAGRSERSETALRALADADGAIGRALLGLAGRLEAA